MTFNLSDQRGEPECKMDEEVSGREYDIVVFGSTGFTGQFVNEELYRLQTDGGRALKWAAAGRSQSKLEASLQGEKLRSALHFP